MRFPDWLVHVVQMDVRAGVAYGIIVDGFDGKFGTYELAITAAQACRYVSMYCVASPLLALHRSRTHTVLRHTSWP